MINAHTLVDVGGEHNAGKVPALHRRESRQSVYAPFGGFFVSCGGTRPSVFLGGKSGASENSACVDGLKGKEGWS